MTTPDEAARFLAEASRLQTAVADAARTRYVAWLVGMAAATAGYYAALASAAHTGSTDGKGAFIPSLAYGLTVIALSLSLLPFARVASKGFAVRWVRALTGWGVLYAATLTAGLTLFEGSAIYWLPAAVIAVAPLVDGARRELRA